MSVPKTYLVMAIEFGGNTIRRLQVQMPNDFNSEILTANAMNLIEAMAHRYERREDEKSIEALIASDPRTHPDHELAELEALADRLSDDIGNRGRRCSLCGGAFAFGSSHVCTTTGMP